MKRPAYQWHVPDARSDEVYMLMTYEQRGVYRELLDQQWVEGSLPANPQHLAGLLRMPVARFEKLWPLISGKFRARDDGRLINDRLESYRREVDEFGRRRAVAGQQGGKAKANELLRRERLAAARQIASHTDEEWLALLVACDYRCVKCGALEGIEKDHVKPIYQGGDDGIQNIQPLCRTCNSAKGPENCDYVPSNARASLVSGPSNRLAKRSSVSVSVSVPSVKEQHSGASAKPPSPAREFLSWFQDEYRSRRDGAAYFVAWGRHMPIVTRLLNLHSPERLRKHATILLTSNDDWITSTDRGIEVLAGKINWLEERLAAWETKRKAREAV